MRKNRVIKGGVNTLAEGGKTTGRIRLIIENQPVIIFMSLEDLLAFRNDINDSLSNYIRRMENIKNGEG